MPLAIVTGSSLGLGYETARGLLWRGFEVVLSSRDPSRGAAAIEKLKNEQPGATVSCINLDLADPKSIEAFATEISRRYIKWDVLVNNAGAKVLSKFTRTLEGVEYHFGVNAVGHFALTSLLAPMRAQTSRVVSVSSIVARFAPKQLGPAGSESNYSPGESYAASKLSNLLFALELQKKFGSQNFASFAAHPGFAKAEPYGSASTRFFESFLAQSAESGARPIIEASVSSKLRGGSYRAPKYLELWGQPTEAKVPESCSPDNLQSNWKILEELSGRKLVF